MTDMRTFDNWRNGEKQTAMLREFLKEIQGERCQFCKEHNEPVVNSRGMCAYCEDQLM